MSKKGSSEERNGRVWQGKAWGQEQLLLWMFESLMATYNLISLLKLKIKKELMEKAYRCSP